MRGGCLACALMVVAVVTSACAVTPGAGPPPPARSTSTTSTTTSPTTTTAAVPWRSVCAVPVAAWPRAALVEQLIMVESPFSELSAGDPEARAGVGGFVFLGQPPAGAGAAVTAGVAALAADADAGGQVAPWMSTDEEGGTVQRLALVIGALPSARAMAARWTTAQVAAAMTSHGAALRRLGITMDLAPVLDTASATDSVADEGDRSFSDDPLAVGAYGVADARGLRSAGVVAVAKHFPGLGQADADTDVGPAVDPPLSELELRDLVPFEDAVAAGIPVVMVGHPAVPGLTDGLPASLAPATYTLLRQALRFTGVTMTDSLGAGAVSAAGYSQPAAAVAALEAGADMVMVEAASWPATVEALEQALGDGTVSLSKVEASVTRILRAKGVAVCGAVSPRGR